MGNQNVISAGDRNCYIYFDTEFTGLRKNTDLISIGLVTADGNTFYAEFTDYDKSKVTPWIKDNVIDKLKHPDTVINENKVEMCGTKTQIHNQLIKWLESNFTENQNIQFVSDVSHYDFVLLIDLLLNDDQKTSIDLPENISPACYDLNQDIATAISVDLNDPAYASNYVPCKTAFNISREYMVKNNPELSNTESKHNSLHDALIIRAIHQNIWNIEK